MIYFILKIFNNNLKYLLKNKYLTLIKGLK